MALTIRDDEHINGILLTGNFSAERDKALAWSGSGNREQAEELRQQGYQTIEDTPGGTALNQAMPYEAVVNGEINKDDYDKSWSEASNQFSKAQEGDITTRVAGAAEDRDFRAVELPNFVEDKKVSSINGIPREELQESYHSNHDEAFNKICEAEKVSTAEKQMPAVSESSLDNNLSSSTEASPMQQEVPDWKQQMKADIAEHGPPPPPPPEEEQTLGRSR